ncbi:MAG: HAD-IIA family hydrolase [Verrucomicrobia bacterium]|nr:HAD-IIA family hydrolase [Verrucomicrobiota bacterium]
MIRALILDLDGTVYRGKDEVPGASDFLRTMRAAGLRCLFVTNRANRPLSVVCEHIRSYGIPCEPQDVLTTAQAAAEYVGQRRTYLIGEEGIREEFARRAIPLDDVSPECVVISFDREFDYAKLLHAATLIRAGAEFIVTNPDAWLVQEGRVYPGTGALAAAVEVGCGMEPVIIGKPERRLFDQAVRILGLPPEQVLAIGDNLATDVPAALRAGLPAALLLTGVSTRADLAHSTVHPTWVADSYAELAELIEQENARGARTFFLPVAPSRTNPPPPASAEDWIRTLGLQRHPEGGYFRETYRAKEEIESAALPPRFTGRRAHSTAILYLLAGHDFSAFHRVRSDELWHYHAGAGLRLHVLSPDGVYTEIGLGTGPHQSPQVAIPAGHWFAAEPADPAGYVLAGCTVAPGFAFADFELARRAELHQRYPAHFALIDRLTR